MGSCQRSSDMKVVITAVVILGLISSSYSLKCATCNGLYWGCEDANDNGESKDCETTCFISHAVLDDIETFQRGTVHVSIIRNVNSGGCATIQTSDHCYNNMIDDTGIFTQNCYCNSDNCNNYNNCAENIDCVDS